MPEPLRRCPRRSAAHRSGDGVVPARFARDQRGVAPDRLAVAAPDRARRPSAAAARPDTTCPGRNAASRPARSGRAGGGSARRRGCAWSGRPRRCSIPPTDSRRSTRRSARRPWSGARRCATRSASTLSPSASSAAQASSENGAVTRGCLGDARDAHVEGEVDLGRLDQAGDRRGRAVVRRRGERQMAFRRTAGRRSDRARSSRRPADRPRSRRADR